MFLSDASAFDGKLRNAFAAVDDIFTVEVNRGCAVLCMRGTQLLEQVGRRVFIRATSS